jgi:SGNH hydrolase-like domain, acetyltransferase AlgX
MKFKYLLIIAPTMICTALAQTLFDQSYKLIEACPQMRALPQNQFPGVKWVLGSKTERMFIDFLFDPYDNIDMSGLTDLKIFNDSLKKKGSTLIVLPIPRNGMFYEDIVDKSDLLINGFDYQKAQNSYANIIKSFNKNDIFAIDLTESIINAKKNTSDNFFYKRDIHWTSDGAKNAAGVVSEYIQKNFNLTDIKKYSIGLTKDKVYNAGGFGHYARTLCGIDVPFEKTETVLLQTENVGLLDVVDDQIVVWGNSYGKVEIDWGFAPNLSNNLQMNVRNESVPSGGVIAAPIKFLSNLPSDYKFPKFIIWLSSTIMPPKWLFEELQPTLEQCSERLSIRADSVDIGISNDFAVKEGDFLKLSNFELEKNLTIDFFSGNEKLHSHTFTRFGGSYTIPGTNFFLSLRSMVGKKITHIVFSDKSKSDTASLTMCGTN